GSARDRHAQLPALPAPARCDLRAAPRRARRALADERLALLAGGRVPGPCIQDRAHRRLDRGLPPLRMAVPTGRPRLLEPPPRARRTVVPDRRVTPELRARVRADV